MSSASEMERGFLRANEMLTISGRTGQRKAPDPDFAAILKRKTLETVPDSEYRKGFLARCDHMINEGK